MKTATPRSGCSRCPADGGAGDGTPSPVPRPGGTDLPHGSRCRRAPDAGPGERANYAGYANTAAASLFPTNGAVLDLARAQGGTPGHVHPYDAYPDPRDSTQALTHTLPADLALGKVEYYEALGFVDDPMATARVWYQLLNCGFRLPAGAGTDTMANFASLRGPVGMNRVYVRSGVLQHRHWLAALRAGRSFATNGPLLEFSLGGGGLGDEIRLPAGGRELLARVTLRSYVPVDHLEIVANGEVIQDLPLAGDRTSLTTTVRLPVNGSGWYLLRARADRAAYPVLDYYPYATTSRIYVTVGDQPIRSQADAEYFVAWIDRLIAGASAHGGWNTEAEKREALAWLRQAREEFERRARE